jgi:type I restriction enzyme S subunit
MGLSKLGKYIEPSDFRNADETLSCAAVVGLSTQKQIISTKADLVDVSLTTYKLFPPNHFAYVPDTSRRGDKVSLGYNTTNQTFLVSSISIVFKVNKPDELLSDYLYMYFNRSEFDRYARFNSWGSAREAFSWGDMCEMEIDLPPHSIQQKHVDVYNAMLANQRFYERGLDDLKLTCDAYIDELRRDMPHTAIGKYIELSDERNSIGLGADAVRGLAISKELIATKADLEGVGLSNYKVMRPNFIAYVSDTSRRNDKMSLAMNNTDETYLVSSISTVFSTNAKNLLASFLMMFFSRTEFDRYARFNSWGSARETFAWADMQEVKIPIPDTKIQQSIVDIYHAYITRRQINEKLKAQMKDICPILIKGSIEEAKRSPMKSGATWN